VNGARNNTPNLPEIKTGRNQKFRRQRALQEEKYVVPYSEEMAVLKNVLFSFPGAKNRVGTTLKRTLPTKNEM
jgi:hypothetical protein